MVSTNLTNITNFGLLNICFKFTGGGWLVLEADISIDDCKNMVNECLKYLNPIYYELQSKSYKAVYCDCDRFLSSRQLICAENAIFYLMHDKLPCAINEFMDCIDNYEEARREKPQISYSEFSLYYVILIAFREKLKLY